MKIHDLEVTGSLIYNGVNLLSLTSSVTDSGSFSTQIVNLNQVSSSLNSFTSSINTTIKSKLDSESVISGSAQVLITNTTGYSTFSSSISSSIGSLSGSVATTTSGLAGRIESVETKTGSYATTGSNVFVGSQVITGSICSNGNIVTTGQIVAQTINVQQVTSSIVYSCGSNIFGTAINNTQQFTGSILATGSLIITGPLSATTIYGSTAVCSPVGNFSNCLTFGDWTTTTNVLTSNKPNEQGAYIRAAVSSAEYPTYTFEDDRDTGIYRNGTNSLGFATSGSARMTISSTGDSLFNGTIVVQGSCSSRICLIKDYSGSPSNPGFVITNTNGVITFNHNANGGGTSISGVTCIGSNFCVAGASYFAGVIGLGITSPSANLDINATGGLGGYTGIRIKYGTSSVQSLSMGQVTAGNGAWIGMAQYNNAGFWQTEGTAAAVLNFEGDGTFRISTNCGLTANANYNICERMRISANGNVGIRCTSPGFTLDVCGTANINNGCYASAPTLTITGQIYPIIDLISQDTNVGNRNWRIAGVSGNYGTFEILSSTAANLGAGTTRLAIDNIGRVGIGPLYPNYNLHICCSGQVISNIQVNSTTAGSEAGILITTPDSIGLLTVGASASRGLTDAARCDMVMGLRTGGKIRFSTDINANTTHMSIAGNGITSFTCQICAPYAIFNGTAAVTLPVGTTAQRPGPSTGMIRFNSSCTDLEYYNGNDWLFFTSTPQSQGYYADVLVVAGGGGGGGAEASNGYGGGGAGGGAGGYVAGRIFINYTVNSYSVWIGAGGTGGANNPQSTGSGCNGTMGIASCALGLIAIGGGFGGGDETGINAGNGGSGGGQGGDNTGTQGCGTLGQGCAGGYSSVRNGGGGGGASTTGCHGYGGSGAGGQGRSWYNGTTYAGGGGGGNGAAVNTTTYGGAGGGGNGSATDGTSGNQVAGGTATAGTANTGGGGGGGAAGRAQGGQNGGSGIVIVRYYGSQKGFGGTITSSDGYTYHSFTSSGTYCATYY